MLVITLLLVQVHPCNKALGCVFSKKFFVFFGFFFFGSFLHVNISPIVRPIILFFSCSCTRFLYLNLIFDVAL